MKKINLAITGCMGRMGRQIIKSAKSDKNFKIVTLTENRIINKKIYGIIPSLNTAEAFKRAETYIKEYKTKENELIRARRVARNNGNFFLYSVGKKYILPFSIQNAYGRVHLPY